MRARYTDEGACSPLNHSDNDDANNGTRSNYLHVQPHQPQPGVSGEGGDEGLTGEEGRESEESSRWASEERPSEITGFFTCWSSFFIRPSRRKTLKTGVDGLLNLIYHQLNQLFCMCALNWQLVECALKRTCTRQQFLSSCALACRADVPLTAGVPRSAGEPRGNYWPPYR